MRVKLRRCLIPVSVFPTRTLAFFFTICCIFQKNAPLSSGFISVMKQVSADSGESTEKHCQNLMPSNMPPESDETYRNAMSSALRILSRRDHTVWELNKKLGAKGVSEEAIRRVVAECRRLGYLDDERTALALINRFKLKGCGIRRARFEMRQRGLSGDAFIRLLQSRFSPEEELGLARRTLERKLKACSATGGGLATKGRLYRFLFGRGFSELSIRTALDELDSALQQGSDGRAT
ncbi:MAG: regulatory protein RecX [Desulfobacterales bacterium]